MTAETAPLASDAYFDSSPCGIVAVGLDGAIAEVNEAFGRMFGWPAEELLGRPLLDLADPSDNAWNFSHADDLLSGHRTHVT